MNHQFPYVDANYSYVNFARSFDMRSVSASPSSNYVQEPMRNNLYDSSNPSNLQHVNLNSHASATPEFHMPMSNMMSSVNKYETPNAINLDVTQESVSPFYSSANNLQYDVSPSHMPMDRGIGHATTS